MPSYQITITPSRRAAARHVNQVRRTLQKAFTDEAAQGLTQSEIARALGVHRSVVNRELRGAKDITHGRVGELAWAMGYKPTFGLQKIKPVPGANVGPQTSAGTGAPPSNSAVVTYGEPVPATQPATKVRVEIYEEA